MEREKLEIIKWVTGLKDRDAIIHKRVCLELHSVVGMKMLYKRNENHEAQARKRFGEILDYIHLKFRDTAK